MEFDILSAEFFEMAQKAKEIYEEKEKKTNAFKEIWVKHKQEILELEKKAEQVKSEYAKLLASKKAQVAEEHEVKGVKK